MGPADAGIGRFDGRSVARLRRAAPGPPVSPREVSGRSAQAWIQVGLLPAGMVGALALFAQDSVVGIVLAVVWALVVLPRGAAFLVRRSPEGADHFRDLETNYWHFRDL